MIMCLNDFQPLSDLVPFFFFPLLCTPTETFDSLMRQAENHTNAILQVSYQKLAVEAAGPVGELFTDIGLFLLGSELNVDEFVQRFFDSLFPLVYNHFLNPDLPEISSGYSECVRSLSRDLRPFGGAPGLLADQVARSGVSGRLLLQALHLGIEVINTTDHLQLSRECRRALLKMHYCPHCQGLTQSMPCMGYCLNVMRGCLASVAEIDPHWREFVRSLEGLSARMHGAQDLEQVLLGVHMLLHNAVGHAQKNGPRLAAQVHKVCGQPSSKPAQSVSIQHSSNRESIPLKAPIRVSGDSLASRRRDFLNSLRLYLTFYGGLADQLCVTELAAGDGLSCWNGTSIVKRFVKTPYFALIPPPLSHLHLDVCLQHLEQIGDAVLCQLMKVMMTCMSAAYVHHLLASTMLELAAPHHAAEGSLGTSAAGCDCPMTRVKDRRLHRDNSLYTLRVVGNGIRAQSVNPEVKVKEADPVINQIIDKLKHINQGKSIPKLGSLDQIETGSGDAEGRYSGECDDEDGCAGSGGGEVKRKVSRVSKSLWIPPVLSLLSIKHANNLINHLFHFAYGDYKEVGVI
ncbi:unnamed protein product [Menidia menidia]|uniref:(Atlantic silverside) hypothetical protein n=1 Tax=Menidia menidia TaxID=238744 RepID=A0A8S4ACT3_9TELE|nr:unnamed protein product [Menidia menidia]